METQLSVSAPNTPGNTPTNTHPLLAPTGVTQTKKCCARSILPPRKMHTHTHTLRWENEEGDPGAPGAFLL